MVVNGKAVSQAYIKARAAIGAIVVKDSKANYGKYASLAAVLELVTPTLSANGLALIQEPQMADDHILVFATLLHESGETIEFTPIAMPIGNNRTAQAVGSAITYGRRYQLTALLGIAADDDDGATASVTMPAKAPTRPVEAIKPVETTPLSGDVLFVQEDAESTVAIITGIEALGMKVYGADWSTKRHELASALNRDSAGDPSKLSEQELRRMRAGIQAKMATKTSEASKRQF